MEYSQTWVPGAQPLGFFCGPFTHL